MNIVRDGELHEDLIALLVKRLKVQNYLELGAGNGETLMKATAGAEPTCRFTAVDIRAPAFHIPSVAFYVMDTQAFLRDTAPAIGPFDFAFIDACHDKAAAWADLIGVLPHVTEHGLVILHDTFPGSEADTAPGLCGTVWMVAQDLKDDDLECMTIPFHPGMSIIRKRKRHLPW